MKKILTCLLVSVVFVLLTGLSVYSNDKVEYIKQTFGPHMVEFMQHAEKDIVGIRAAHVALRDESDSKAHYYLIMEIDPLGFIEDLYASHQIELDGNNKMICNEGIRMDRETNKYKYFIDSYIIYRNKNYKKEVVQSVEVWDKILNHFFK